MQEILEAMRWLGLDPDETLPFRRLMRMLPATDRLQCRPLTPTLPVRLYVLSASHSPLSHGARELVKCVAAMAQRCVDGAAA